MFCVELLKIHENGSIFLNSLTNKGFITIKVIAVLKKIMRKNQQKQELTIKSVLGEGS